MPSRRLTAEEATKANEILAQTKSLIEAAAAGDPVLLFAMRRRLFTRLMHWERSTPAERNKLKAIQWRAQDGRCGLCGELMEQKGSELDRADPVLGYTVDNTRLVHHECHRRDQSDKGFR